MVHAATVIGFQVQSRVTALKDGLIFKLNSKAAKVCQTIAERTFANGEEVTPTAECMMEILREEMLRLGTQLAEEMLKNVVETSPRVPREKRGKNLQNKGLRTRKIKTILGEVNYERQAYYQPKESRLVFPDDELLGIKGGEIQLDFIKRAVKAGLEMPYAEAAEICGSLMGISISEGAIHQALTEAGEFAKFEQVVPTVNVIKNKIENLKSTDNSSNLHVVVGVDGAMEPMRPEDAQRQGKRGECFWSECKGFRVYAIAGEHLTHLVSWHQVCNENELGIYINQIAVMLSEMDIPVGIIADGAKWIWKHIDSAFGKQRGVYQLIDWYHVVEYVSKYASVQYRQDKKKQKEWVTLTKDRLMTGSVGRVIHGLQRKVCSTQEAENEKQRLISYLTNNRQRMNYHLAKEKGYTIGSGGMESANKSVSHTRLKRTGAWWKPSHANEILKLRCAKVNGTLDEILDSCWKKKKIKLENKK